MFDSFLVAPEVFKKRGEIAFTTKAYNGRVVSEWLCQCLDDARSQPALFQDPDNQLLLLNSCMFLAQRFSDLVILKSLFFLSTIGLF